MRSKSEMRTMVCNLEITFLAVAVFLTLVIIWNVTYPYWHSTH